MCFIEVHLELFLGAGEYLHAFPEDGDLLLIFDLEAHIYFSLNLIKYAGKC
jgi:hypothetical protein